MINELTLDNLIASTGPTCLVIKARLEPVGDQDRFQPAGFPEIGHVIYPAPRRNGESEKVCIIDSAASMANHLEAVCIPDGTELHPDLSGIPYVLCVTGPKPEGDADALEMKPDSPNNKVVVTSLTEGHRIASEYFVDKKGDRCFLNAVWVKEKEKTERKGVKEEKTVIPAHWEGETFRDRLRREFGIVEVKKNTKYFIHPEDWWAIYQTIFKYDPNSLIHGILLATEQIKISRLLTASLEAFGAARVGRSGVKFDRLGKTLSGQPIFAVDEETAREIRATFILDLALLRSYGRTKKLPDNSEETIGLNDSQKKLLLGLALWKIKSLLAQPFRYRSQCYLRCSLDKVKIAIEGGSPTVAVESQSQAEENTQAPVSKLPPILSDLQMSTLISACNFGGVTKVFYPADKLFEEEEPTNEGAPEVDDEAPSTED